jgi:cytochrome c biogenesis protein CcmG, thiol:disulfide interchange protein DsbE
MALTAKRVGQVLALVAVAALLGLLVWKITKRDGGVAAELSQGRNPAAPTTPYELLNTADRGKLLSIADLKGKAVVVNFWASWCIPCKEETPYLQKVYEKYKNRGLVVLGIDNEDLREDARRFLTRYGVTYPVVYSKGASAAGRWGTRGYPETFFVDRQGRLVGERISGGVDLGRNKATFEAGIRLALGTDSTGG